MTIERVHSSTKTGGQPVGTTHITFARIEDGPTGDEVIVGTVSDLTGVTSLKLGVEQVDPVTGHQVQLTPGKRATHIVSGGVQLALTITGLTAAGRSFGEELRLFSNRLGGGGGGGLQPQLVTSTAGLRVSGPPTATLGATGTGTAGGVLVGTLSGLRPVVVYMTREEAGLGGSGRPTSDDIAANMDPEDFDIHGDPDDWSYLGEKGTSGQPADSSEARPGTLKIFEVWRDEFGALLEVHYFRDLLGGVSDVKLRPYTG